MVPYNFFEEGKAVLILWDKKCPKPENSWQKKLEIKKKTKCLGSVLCSPEPAGFRGNRLFTAIRLKVVCRVFLVDRRSQEVKVLCKKCGPRFLTYRLLKFFRRSRPLGRLRRSWNRYPAKNMSPRRRTTDVRRTKTPPPIYGRSIFILGVFSHFGPRFFSCFKSFFAVNMITPEGGAVTVLHVHMPRPSKTDWWRSRTNQF